MLITSFLNRLRCRRIAIAFGIALSGAPLSEGQALATVALNGGQSLTLDGAGESLSSLNNSAVGRTPGIATLNILNGATLGSGSSGVGTINSSLSGIEGRVFIVGQGSRWQNAGAVFAGFNATGRIHISDSAALTAESTTTSPAMWIGVRNLGVPANGEVIIDGTGSAMSLGGQLAIGSGGAMGSLSILNGASITSALSAGASVHSGVVGSNGGTGFAQVDGIGSTWTQDGRLAVGISGQSLSDARGDLIVSNGGEVRANSVIFGAIGSQSQGPPGIGAGTVSGGRLISDTFITVGRGSLSIQGDSQVVAGSGLGLSGPGTGTVFFNGGKLDAGDIGLAGGRLHMNTVTPLLLRARSISYPVPNFFGCIDLGAGGSAFEYNDATTLSEITDELVRGRAGGSWTGNGITSSLAVTNPQTHAVGIAEASETGLTSLFGETFDDTTVLVRYTLLGDATLDGTVDISDFSNLAANFNQPGRWFKGDFDYSGTTDIGDFALLAANFNQSLPAARAALPEPLAGPVVLCVLAALRRPRS